MPLLHTGTNYTLVSALCRLTELNEQLANLGLSSELVESSMLNSPRRVDGTNYEVKIPDSLVENLYALYHYDVRVASWIKVTDYKRANNKLTLKKLYTGLLVAFPFDAFRTTVYRNGSTVYEMYLTRLDGRVYRDITIGTSSYLPSKHIELLFSFSPTGPWLSSINSPFLFPTFYMQINITNISSLTKAQVVPSELITLTCLTCE